MNSKPHKRFSDDMLKSKKKPKLPLRIIQAARHYHESTTAMAESRRELVAEVLMRVNERPEAAELLRMVAREFKLPPFGDADFENIDHAE
ncbi:MAG: hypothetical protein ACJ8C4_15470 [Gemmataceae bacterium]